MPMFSGDTIVAASTAAGRSGRGIVRLSGPQALDLLRGLIAEWCAPPFSRGSYRAFPLELSLDGVRLPARVYVMRAPASYTREDIVEVHTFGNPALLSAVLAALTRAGARPAGPGEFTRRAFVNGRLDLAQAEAVQSLVRARGEAEFRAAAIVLSRHLSRRVADLREHLADLAALVEVSLDFSDQDVETLSHSEVTTRLAPLRNEIKELLAAREGGQLPCHAVRAVLFGPPNAGKSSLFNAILPPVTPGAGASAPTREQMPDRTVRAHRQAVGPPDRRRAIVSPHPGTTRDTVEATTVLDGFELLLVDTAGLRPPQDDVEAVAVARSRESIRRADLGLCVLDRVSTPGPEEREAMRALDPGRVLVLLNKCDLGPCHPLLEQQLPRGAETISVSARDGTGIPRVLQRIRERVQQGQVDCGPSELMVNARQAGLLERALQAMERPLASEDGAQSMDLVASDIREALAALSALTAERGLDGADAAADVTEDVLDRIFSAFCIGK